VHGDIGTFSTLLNLSAQAPPPRLAKVMRELGWTPLRVRGLTAMDISSKSVRTAANLIVATRMSSSPGAPP